MLTKRLPLSTQFSEVDDDFRMVKADQSMTYQMV